MEIKITNGSIRFVNIGEDARNSKKDPKRLKERRQWKACLEYGFVSAGQGKVYSNALKQLKVGDIIAAFITKRGYVGIGKVISSAKPIRYFKFNGIQMVDLDIETGILMDIHSNQNYVKKLPYLKESIFENAENEKTEWVVGIEWLKSVNHKNDAYWVPRNSLFASRSVQCSMANQHRTILYLEECFGVNFKP